MTGLPGATLTDAAGASRRYRAVAAAGAALAAATGRAEAMRATLEAALAMGDDVDGAAIATRKGSTLRVATVAGRTGGDRAGTALDLADLPPDVAAVLTPGGYARLAGAAAQQLTGRLGLAPRSEAALASLSVRDDVFGLLLLACTERPDDHMATIVPALASQAAFTLDRLLAATRLQVIVEHSPDALFLAGDTGVVRLVNPAAEQLVGLPARELTGRDLTTLIHPDDLAATFDPTRPPGSTMRLCRIRGRDGDWTEVEMTVSRVVEHDGSHSLVVNARDISDRQRLELELRHAQKLESVGRLAAGIAHEINTPIQFIGDNVRFLRDCLTGMLRLHAGYTDLAAAVDDDPEVLRQRRDQVQATADEIDVGFILDEVPTAVDQTLDGVNRVARLVGAMKAFGHPGTENKTQVDLNASVTSTLTVATNETKYVADVETDLAELPPVWGHGGDINQVVLNLVVNAAHAIDAAGRGRGRIRVSTRVEGEYAVIEVADTGTGIDPAIADKIFEPFFTTKDVGTGTGQGLALVRTLVVDRHEGAVAFTSEPGAGTVFTVHLPTGARDTPTPPTAR